MAGKIIPHPEQRHRGAVARVEGRTATIPLADVQAYRVVDAFIAIALTIWGALAPAHL
jgi:hypothetical protein